MKKVFSKVMVFALLFTLAFSVAAVGDNWWDNYEVVLYQSMLYFPERPDEQFPWRDSCSLRFSPGERIKVEVRALLIGVYDDPYSFELFSYSMVRNGETPSLDIFDKVVEWNIEITEPVLFLDEYPWMSDIVHIEGTGDVLEPSGNSATIIVGASTIEREIFVSASVGDISTSAIILISTQSEVAIPEPQLELEPQENDPTAELPPEPELITPEPIVAETRTLRFTIGSTTYTNNGASHTLEAAPFIAGSRTMVPLSVIGEALGATDLALTDSVVSFTLNGRTIIMTIGEALPNNMGTPVIAEGRTFVPLAFVVNEMGATARWDSSARAAYIYIG